MASAFSQLVSQESGLLPKALFLVGVVSIANTFQAFVDTSYTSLLYNRSPSSGQSKTSQVTPLSSRTFGIWSLLSGCIRLYAAFHISDTHVYRLTFLTWILGSVHFLSEVFVFQTADLKGRTKAPLIVAGTMAVWMLTHWTTYTGAGMVDGLP